MPDKKRKFVDFEARMVKLAREYPAEVHEPDEIAIVVIKTHLLAENYLDSILELAANDPQKLALDESIGFAAKVRLVRAFTSFGDDDRWPIVDALNILRNRVAHQFKGPEREEALKNLRLEIIRRNMQNPTAPDDPSLETSMLLQVAGALSLSLFVQILHSLADRSVVNRLRMTDAKMQPQLFQELCNGLRTECRNLEQRFALLSISRRSEVREKYAATKRLTGFDAVQRAILEICLGTTLRLVQERSGGDPSGATLARLFDRENRSQFHKCLKILEEDYVSERTQSSKKGDRETAQKPIDEEKARTARKEFWVALETICVEWKALKEKADDFISRLERWGRLRHLAKQLGGNYKSRASRAKLDIPQEIRPIISMMSDWLADVSRFLNGRAKNGLNADAARTAASEFWNYSPKS
jgi:hypothetical protein